MNEEQYNEFMARISELRDVLTKFIPLLTQIEINERQERNKKAEG